MIRNNDDMIEAILILVKNENAYMTVKQSVKGAVICGVSAFTGSLIFGPIGLAVGSAIGGIGAYILTRKTFRPLWYVIIHDFTDEQRNKLLEHVLNAIQIAFPFVLTSEPIKKIALAAVYSFVSNELKSAIVNK